ncbi:hypothetical protein KAR91_47175 [Candidatus Pacearchaeota archaeon]|nr:hypothetical protein [Candidatus Pacearchaeota archaeon]
MSWIKEQNQKIYALLGIKHGSVDNHIAAKFNAMPEKKQKLIVQIVVGVIGAIVTISLLAYGFSGISNEIDTASQTISSGIQMLSQ